MALVSPQLSGSLLDYGAGTAKYRSLFLPYVTSYASLDADASMKPNIVGDVLDPPLPDAAFDAVVSNQVLEHVREPWVMVEQIARLLKPGGQCVITAPFLIGYHADPDDYFRYTTQGIRYLCERAGLQVELSEPYGGWVVSTSESLKQRFFSHYRPRSRLRKLLGRMTEHMSALLNPLLPPGRCYANVVCIAKKP